MKNVKPTTSAVIACLATGLLALGGLFFPAQLWIVCAVLGVVFALGWPGLLGLPARKTLFAVVGVCAVASAIASSALLFDARFGITLLVIAMGVCAIFVVQLVRGTGQAYRLESTMGGAAAVLMVCLGSAWAGLERVVSESFSFGWFAYAPLSEAGLVAGEMPGDFVYTPPVLLPSGLIFAAAVSIIVTLIAGTNSLRNRISAPVSVILGTVVSTALSVWVANLYWQVAAITALVTSLIVAACRRLARASKKQPAGFLASVSLGLAPVLVCGPVVFIVGVISAAVIGAPG